LQQNQPPDAVRREVLRAADPLNSLLGRIHDFNRYMQVAIVITVIISLSQISIGQTPEQRYESIRGNPEFSHVIKALRFLVREESEKGVKGNQFYVVKDTSTENGLVYWKEKDTVYLWIPGLPGTTRETEIAHSKRQWNGKRDVCPPATCAFGSTYMMKREDYLKLVRACLKYGDRFTVSQ
jgi:hypothetical protein